MSASGYFDHCEIAALDGSHYHPSAVRGSFDHRGQNPMVKTNGSPKQNNPRDLGAGGRESAGRG